MYISNEPEFGVALVRVTKASVPPVAASVFQFAAPLAVPPAVSNPGFRGNAAALLATKMQIAAHNTPPIDLLGILICYPHLSLLFVFPYPIISGSRPLTHSALQNARKHL
jgi:hypothetical protein